MKQVIIVLMNENENENQIENTTACALPWIHLATHPQGQVSLCCRAAMDNAIGMARNTDSKGGTKVLTLNQQTITQILNSDSFCQTRLSMLKGEKPEACKGCYADEARGVESKRLKENAAYKFDLMKAQQQTSLEGKIDVNLRFVELRLGNLCNLKCRTCNPASSSKWKSDYSTLEEQLPFVRSYKETDNFSWVESQEFWSDLEKSSSELEVIYINGGEPTLIKSHWHFLQNLIDSGRAQKICLIYNSNMTYIKPEFCKIWSQFQRVQMGASIDDVGLRNTYIRHPAEWSTVEANIDLLKLHGVELHITQTVSAYNLFYLDELNTWSEQKQIPLGYNFVTDPSFLAAKALPKAVRDAALEKLKIKLPAYQFAHVDAQLAAEGESEEFEKFKKYNQVLDTLRKEKFEEVFPELFELQKEKGR